MGYTKIFHLHSRQDNHSENNKRFLMIEKNKIEQPPNRMLRMLEKASKGVLVLSLVCGIISGASSIFLLSLVNDILHINAATEGYQSSFLLVFYSL